MGRAWAPLSAAVVVAALAAPAAAKEPVHVMRPGETLGAVARHYYGSGWKAVYILGRNRIDDAGSVGAGTKVVIPGSWIYNVRRGDSPSRIAKRMLGDTDRYEVLMKQNAMRPTADLEVGAELLMPFHIIHTVAPGEGYSGLAKRYYRSSRKGSVIKSYNDDKELHPGDKVTVPIFDRSTVDARDKGPPPPPSGAAEDDEDDAPPDEDEAPADEPAPPAETPGPPVTDADVHKAIGAYDAGDFRIAQQRLELLLERQPAAKQRAAILRYLAFCAVAHAERDTAADYFRQLLELAPRTKLDPVRTSPKILEVFHAVANEND